MQRCSHRRNKPHRALTALGLCSCGGAKRAAAHLQQEGPTPRGRSLTMSIRALSAASPPAKSCAVHRGMPSSCGSML